MKTWVKGFWLLLMVALSVQAQQSLGHQLQYWNDSTGNLTFEEMLSMRSKGIPCHCEVPSFGFTASAYWFRVQLKDLPKEPHLLVFKFPHMDSLQYHYQDSRGIWRMVQTGYALPFSSRPIPHSQFVFEVPPGGGEFWFRLRNSDRMEAPIELWTEKNFIAADQKSQILQGLFIGLVVISLTLNLLMFLIFKERSYLHYSLFLFFFGVFVATHMGILYEYIWPSAWHGFQHYNRFSIGALLFSLTLLTRSYLDLRKHSLSLDRFLQGVQYFQLAVMCLLIALPIREGTQLEVILTAIIMAIVFTISTIMIRTGTVARYFFVAWFIALLTGVFYALKALGVLQLDWFVIEWLALAWVVQFIILSLGLGEKLTQERRLQEQLRQTAIDNLEKSNQIKDDFLANTSHELRTPLNGIIGIAESLMDGAAGPLPQESREQLRVIVHSGRRLSHLVNDILDLSKLRNGEIILKESAIDLRTLTELVLQVLMPLAQQKKLGVYNEIPADLPLVKGDENRLQQILYNLVGNAIKFTLQGRVTLGAVQEQSRIRIWVEDTGPGIAPEKQEKIFEAFYQEDYGTTRAHGGTGIGLNVAQHLVRLHESRLELQSSSAGSHFAFTLEQAEKHIPSANLQHIPQMAILSGGDEFTVDSSAGQMRQDVRILCVDDDPINLRVLYSQLSKRGYRVDLANSGFEALDKMEKGPVPDLILLDVMMPKMNGFEVCRRLRESYDIGILPILMLTAKTEVSALIEGFEAGANDYISKPIAYHELLARIQTHTHLSRVSQAYARFVPQQFLKQLGKTNIASVALGDHVEQSMAVLFLEIVNLNALCESMNAEENFNFLNSYLGRIGPMILANDGFIDKYIGDGLMALFPDSAENAVLAAQGILKEMEVYNEHRARSGYAPVQIGMGVHYGTLMLGTIGEKNRMDGTVIADAVNLASRIAQLNRVLNTKILISEATVQALANSQSIGMKSLGEMKIRGKELQVKIYEVLIS